VERPPVRETVLVLEDEPSVRKLVRQVLESRGFAVLETGGVEEALSTLENHAPSIDLVISETLLPGKSCTKLVKHLRTTRPDIGLILMSGVDDRADRESAFGTGIPFIAKPFSVQGFVEAVQAAIDTRPRR
jgi:DNA-binding response OmpR family regulator